MRRGEVRVEYDGARGEAGQRVRTGRVRLIVDAEVSSELAAELVERLAEAAYRDDVPDSVDAGAGI